MEALQLQGVCLYRGYPVPDPQAMCLAQAYLCSVLGLTFLFLNTVDPDNGAPLYDPPVGRDQLESNFLVQDLVDSAQALEAGHDRFLVLVVMHESLTQSALVTSIKLKVPQATDDRYRSHSRAGLELHLCSHLLPLTRLTRERRARLGFDCNFVVGTT